MYIVKSESGNVLAIATRKEDVECFMSDTKDNRGNTVIEIPAKKENED
jgi:hypothetical protein